MRRATSVLVVCLCALTGCAGGAAQEPYDGAVVSGRGSASLRVAVQPVEDAGPIASEVDLPWTIALLSDVEARPADRRVTVVEAESAALEEQPLVEERLLLEEVRVNLHLAIDHALDEKRAPSKTCTGVVKGRS